ncbi:MAG: Ig-like domain-containing protein [Rhodanobacter sp.]|jgi:adhesin/invasin|nr:Ig-like domain-containing protein [Rhodanobacter sp.]
MLGQPVVLMAGSREESRGESPAGQSLARPMLAWARRVALVALALPTLVFGETLTNQTVDEVTYEWVDGALQKTHNNVLYDIVFVVRDNSLEPAFPVSGGAGGNTTPVLATQADCVTATVTDVGSPYQQSNSPRNLQAGFSATGIAQGRCTLTSAIMAANWYMAQNPDDKKVLITFPSGGINPTILPGYLPSCSGSNRPPACNYNQNSSPAYPNDAAFEIYVGINGSAKTASQTNQAGNGAGNYLNGQQLPAQYVQQQYGQAMVYGAANSVTGVTTGMTVDPEAAAISDGWWTAFAVTGAPTGHSSTLTIDFIDEYSVQTWNDSNWDVFYLNGSNITIKNAPNITAGETAYVFSSKADNITLNNVKSFNIKPQAGANDAAHDLEVFAEIHPGAKNIKILNSESESLWGGLSSANAAMILIIPSRNWATNDAKMDVPVENLLIDHFTVDESGAVNGANTTSDPMSEFIFLYAGGQTKGNGTNSSPAFGTNNGNSVSWGGTKPVTLNNFTLTNSTIQLSSTGGQGMGAGALDLGGHVNKALIQGNLFQPSKNGSSAASGVYFWNQDAGAYKDITIDGNTFIDLATAGIGFNYLNATASAQSTGISITNNKFQNVTQNMPYGAYLNGAHCTACTTPYGVVFSSNQFTASPGQSFGTAGFLIRTYDHVEMGKNTLTGVTNATPINLNTGSPNSGIANTNGGANGYPTIAGLRADPVACTNTIDNIDTRIPSANNTSSKNPAPYKVDVFWNPPGAAAGDAQVYLATVDLDNMSTTGSTITGAITFPAYGKAGNVRITVTDSNTMGKQTSGLSTSTLANQPMGCAKNSGVYAAKDKQPVTDVPADGDVLEAFIGDGYFNPVSGVTVTFAATPDVNLGSGVGVGTTCTTGINGLCQVHAASTLASDPATGAIINYKTAVTAVPYTGQTALPLSGKDVGPAPTNTGPYEPSPVSYSFTPLPADGGKSTLIIDPNNMPADGLSVDVATVMLADKYGNRIYDADVTFTATPTAAVITPTHCLTGSAASATPGQCQVEITAIQPGDYTVAAIPPAGTGPQATATFIPTYGDEHASSVRVTKDGATADGIGTDELTVTLVNSVGLFVDGKEATFQLPAGVTSAEPGGALTCTTGDGKNGTLVGVCTFHVKSTLAATYSITVTIVNQSGATVEIKHTPGGIADPAQSSPATVTFKPDTIDPGKSSLKLEPPSAVANNGGTNGQEKVILNLVDANSNRVADGQLVTFSLTSGHATFMNGLQSATCLTKDGDCDVAPVVKSSLGGTTLLTAAFGTGELTTNAVFTAYFPDASKSTLEITLNNQIANGGTTATGVDVATVTVRDAGDTLVPDTVITLSVAGGTNNSSNAACFLDANAGSTASRCVVPPTQITCTTGNGTGGTTLGVCVVNLGSLKADGYGVTAVAAVGNVTLNNKPSAIFVPDNDHPSALTSTLETKPNNQSADGASADGVTVTLRDGNGNLITQATAVTLTAGKDALGNLPVLANGGQCLTSPATGQCTVNVTSTTATAAGDVGYPIWISVPATLTPGAPNNGPTTAAAFINTSISPTQSSVEIDNQDYIAADGATSHRVTVTLRDSSGNLFQKSTTITLSVDSQAFVLSSDANPCTTTTSVCTFHVVSTKSGSFAVGATGNDGTGAATILNPAPDGKVYANFQGGTPVAGSSELKVMTTDQVADSNPVLPNVPDRVRATLLDANRNPVGGQVVNYAVTLDDGAVQANGDAPGLIGTCTTKGLTSTPSVAVTDPSFGTCDITLTSTRATTYTVEATYNGTALSGSPVQVNFVAGPLDPGKTTLEMVKNGAQVNASGPAGTNTVRVATFDKNNNPIRVGTQVTVEALPPNPVLGWTNGHSCITAITNTVAGGFGTCDLDLTSTQVGDFLLEVTAPAGALARTTATFQNTDVSAAQSTLTISPATRDQVAGVGSYTVTATVRDQNNAPVADQTVTFHLPTNVAAGTVVATPPSCTTDQNGQCTTSITSKTAGTYTIGATVTGAKAGAGVTIATTVDAVFIPGKEVAGNSSIQILNTATDNHQVADGHTPDVVTATARDANQNLVPNVVFTFTVTPPTGSGPTSAGGTCTTDDSGSCQFKVTSTLAGTDYTVHGYVLTTQEVNGSPLTIAFVPGDVDMDKSKLSVLSDNAPPGGARNTVQIKLVDANLNPITTATTVSFRAAAGVPSGTAIFDQGTTCDIATSGPSVGACTVTLTSATESDYDVTASVPMAGGPRDSNPVTVHFGFPPVDLTASSVEIDNANYLTADGSAANAHTVTVKLVGLNGGGPVGNQRVSFTLPAALMTVPTAGVVSCTTGDGTGATPVGQCQSQVASTTAGAYGITASVGGQPIANPGPGATTVNANYKAGAVVGGNSLLAFTSAPQIANGKDQDEVTATAKDAFGNPVANIPVNFTVEPDDGQVKLVRAACTTQGDPNIPPANPLADPAYGTCAITLTSTKATTYTVKATTVTPAGTIVFGQVAGIPVSFMAGPLDYTTSYLETNPDSQQANIGGVDRVIVHLLDAYNNAITTSTQMTFGTPVVAQTGDGTANYVSGVNQCRTDVAAGTCYVELTSTGQTTQTTTYTITATVQGGSALKNGAATFIMGGVDGAQSSLEISYPTGGAIANGTSANTLKATVRDTNGTLMSGQTVTFTLPGNVTPVGGNPTCTTVNGVCTLDVVSTVSNQTASAKVPGTTPATIYPITAKMDGVSLAQTPPGGTAYALFVSGTADAGNSTLEVTRNGQVAGSATPDEVKVTLIDGHNNTVTQPTTVTFTALDGSGNSADFPGPTGPSCTTDAATGACLLEIGSKVAPVTYTVTATANGTKLTQTVTVNFTTGEVDPDKSTVSIAPNDQPADGAATEIVTITLFSSTNQPVPNRTLQFTTAVSPDIFNPTGGLQCRTGDGTAGTTNGQCQIPVATFKAGSYLIEVADVTGGAGNQITLPQTVTAVFKAGPADPAHSTLIVNPNNASADGVAKDVATVTLADKFGNLIANALVAFDTPAPVAGSAAQAGHARLGRNSCTTGDGSNGTTLGQCLVEITADVGGDYTISTTSPAVVSATATFSATDPDATKSRVDVTPPGTGNTGSAAVPVGGNYTLKATVQNGLGQAMDGQTVTFRLPSEVSSVPAGTTTCRTDTTGTCSVVVTSTLADTSFSIDVQVTVKGSLTPVSNSPATVSFKPGDIDSNKSSLTLSPASALANNGGVGGTETVVLDLVDASGNKASEGLLVTFTLSDGHAVFQSNGVQSGVSCRTRTVNNKTGCDVSPVLISSLGGTTTLTAVVGGVSLTAKAPFTAYFPDASKSTIAIDPNEQIANGGAAGGADTATVTVRDGGDTLVPNTTITFAVASGTNDNGNAACFLNAGAGSGCVQAQTTISCTTGDGANGTQEGACAVNLGSRNADSYVVTGTAVIGNVVLNTKPSATFVPDNDHPSAQMSTLVVDPNNQQAGTDADVVTVTLKDANGNLITRPTTVTLKADQDTQGHTATLVPASGQCTTSDCTTGPVGTCQVQVTSTTVTRTADDGYPVSISSPATLTPGNGGPIAYAAFKNPPFSVRESSVQIDNQNYIAADGSTAHVVTVTLKDPLGNPLQVPVKVALSLPQGSPVTTDTGAAGLTCSTTTTTNLCTFHVVSSKSGSFPVGAVADDGTGPVTILNPAPDGKVHANFQGGTPTGISTLEVITTDKIANGDPNTPDVARATMLDANRNPVGGVTVSYTVAPADGAVTATGDASGPTGTCTTKGLPGTPITDAGFGTCDITLTSTKAATYTVDATYNSTRLTGSPVSLNFVPGPMDPTRTTLRVITDGAKAGASGAEGTNTVRVTVFDSHGNVIHSDPIRVTLAVDPANQPPPSAITWSPACTTDTTGKTSGGFGACDVDLTSSAVGEFTVGIQSPAGSASTVVVSFGNATVNGANSTLAIDPATSLTADGVAAFTITATVLDDYKVAVSAQPVRLILPPAVSVAGGGNPTCTSDANGQCSVRIVSTKADTYEIRGVVTDTGTNKDVSIAKSVLATFVAGPAVRGKSSIQILNPGTDTNQIADGVTPDVVTATALDANDNLVAKATFHFTIDPTTGLTGTPASGAGTCTTDDTGTCQFKVASKLADRTYTVHAALSTLTPFEDVNGSPLTIIFKPGPLDMSRSTLSVIDNNAKAGGGQNSVQIKLVDTNNNPIKTATTVTFSAAPGVPFGGTALFGTRTTGSCNIATAGTNEGQCPNPVTLTSQTADSYVVTAQVGQETSNPVRVVFTTGAADPAQSSIDYAKDAGGQSITSQPADSVTPFIVVATAKDANGILLADVDFTFKVVPTSGLVGPAASGTGKCTTLGRVGDPAYGTCQFELTSRSAGDYGVTATVAVNGTATEVTGSPLTAHFSSGDGDPAQSYIQVTRDNQTADGTEQDVITATVRDKNGSLVPPGVTVHFTLTLRSDGSTPPSGTVAVDPVAYSCTTSDASGTCEFKVASTQAITYSVLADIGGTPLSGGQPRGQNPVPITFRPGPWDAAHSTLAVDPNDKPADGVAADVITLTLRDAYANLVSQSGVDVEFSAVDTRGIVSLPALRATTCTTRADGTCWVELTSTLQTTYDVSAQIGATRANNGQPVQARFSLSACPGCSTLVVVQSDQAANGVSTDIAILTLKDTNGDPLPNAPATLNVEQGALLSLAPESTAARESKVTCTTDANGQCTVYATSNTPGSYALSLTAPLSAIPVATTVRFADLPKVDATQSNLGMPVNYQPADGTTPDTAQVTLLDANKDPVTGVPVSFTVATGATLLQRQCITGPFGACTVGIISDTAGSYALTASVVAVADDGTTQTITLPTAAQAPVNAVFTGPPDQDHSTLVIDPDRQSANGVSADKATLTAKDADGHPTPGWTVSFTVAAGPLFGPAYATGTATAACTTNNDGQCWVYLTSEQEGQYTVTATVDTVTLTADATFIPICTSTITTDCGADKVDHGTLTIDPNNQPADNTAQDRANVALFDKNNRQVQNVWATFSVTGGAAVTFSPAPSANGQDQGDQCQSDANGECSVRLRSSQPGDFPVSVVSPIARIPIASKIATFKPVCTGAASDPVDCAPSYIPDSLLSRVQIEPNDQPANGASEDGVAIILLDKNSHAVADTRVFLTVESGARLTSTFCDTDANGVCYDSTGHKVGVTSLTAAGYTVTATVQIPNPWSKGAVARFCDPTDPALATCGSGPPATPNSTLEVTQDNRPADGVSPDEVKATLADANKQPVKNARVTFTVQPGARLVNTVCITADGANRTTAGACSQGITSMVTGQYTVGVTAPIPTTPPEVTVTFITPELDQAHSSLTILNDYQPADGASAEQAQFLALDSANQPLQGIPVTFGSDPNVTFLSTTCTTGANGACSVSLASTAQGEHEITATSGLVKETAIAHFRGQISPFTSTLKTTLDALSANGVSQDEVTVTLRDGNGYPVGQTEVSFTVDTGALFGPFKQGTPTTTCTTKSDGTCVVGVTSLTQGTYQVSTTAPVSLAPTTVTFIRVCQSVTDTQCGSGPPDPEHSLLEIVRNKMPANGFSQNLVRATLKDRLDLQVKNAQVTFAVTPADATLASDGACKTDNNGLCNMGLTSEIAGDYAVSTIDPLALGPVTVTFIRVCTSATDTDCGADKPDHGTLVSVVDGMPANGESQDFVEVALYDAFGKPVPGVPTTFLASSGAILTPPGACDTGDGTLGTKAGICRMGVKSFAAGRYQVQTTDPLALGPVIVNFIRLCTSATDTDCGAGPPDPRHSTLIVDPNHQPADGKSQDIATATHKDQYQIPVPSVRVVFDIQVGAFLVQAGTTLPAQECTTDPAQGPLALGACGIGITSLQVGDYTVSTTLPIGMTATASFGSLGTVIPDCTVIPNRALRGQTVTVTCKGGTPGDKVVIPGTSCNPAVIAPTGDLTCTGNASDMGNNPPIVVTNPNTGTNTGVLDLQMTPEGNTPFPPPVPNCVVSPNPAVAGQRVTLTCTNGVPDDIVRIAGTDCDPATIPATGLLICQGNTDDIGSNPVITVTDPKSDLSNSSVIPLEVYVVPNPPLPDCVASPNPARAGQQVTVTCDNGKPGTEVTVPGTDCSATPIPSSGSLTCQGDAGDMGNDPRITITDPDTGGQSNGVIPLEVDLATNPPLPNCKADPKQALPSDRVTASCENGKPGTTITIPGTDCNGKLIPPSGSLICSGTASQMGSNPPITIIDPTGGSSKGVLPLDVGPTTNPPLPDCVANPNPAKAGQSITVTCDNGKPGTQVTVPGTDCSATPIPSSGSLTCQGDAGDMGNNPPITVIDPDTGGSSNGVIPLEVDPTTRPPLPNCTASPKRVLPSDQVVVTCTHARPDTTITIPGTDCNGKLIPPSGNLVCAGNAGEMGSNPSITVVDPKTGQTNEGVLPLDVGSKPPYPKLPDCRAEPNPIAPGQPVTIACQNGQPGTQVTVPGTDCKATVVPATGHVTCTAGSSDDLGNNPVITAYDPVTDLTTQGTIPLVVTPVVAPSDALSVLNIMDDNRPADGVAQDIAEVLLADTNGNPIANTVVRFTVASGATLVNETCRTSAYGACRVGLTATTPGLYAVAVIAPVKIGPVMAAFVGTVSQANSTLFMAVNNMPANGASENRAQVTLRDRNGNPVAGEEVMFAVTSGALFTSNARLSTLTQATPGAPNPVAPSEQVTCTTDSHGMCTVGLTSSVPGTYQVSTISPVTLGPVNAVFIPPIPGAPDAGHSLLVMRVDGAAANGLSQDIAVVALHDANDVPVPNVVVAFMVDAGATLVDAACRTDVDGLCEVGLTSTTAGQYGVAAQAGTLTLGPKQATFIAVCTPTITTNCGAAAPDAAKSKIEVLPPNNAQANGRERDIVQVTLRDANNQAVSSVQVRLTSGVGSTLVSTICLTDASGVCTVGVTSTVPGAYLVETTAPIAMGPVVARFVVPPPPEPIATPALDPRVLFGLMALLAMVALRTMRRGMR